MKVIIIGGVAGGASCAARLRSGQRAYYATRILLQNGFNAKNISGGMLSLAHNYFFDEQGD